MEKSSHLGLGELSVPCLLWPLRAGAVCVPCNEWHVRRAGAELRNRSRASYPTAVLPPSMRSVWESVGHLWNLSVGRGAFTGVLDCRAESRSRQPFPIKGHRGDITHLVGHMFSHCSLNTEAVDKRSCGLIFTSGLGCGCVPVKPHSQNRCWIPSARGFAVCGPLSFSKLQISLYIVFWGKSSSCLSLK